MQLSRDRAMAACAIRISALQTFLLVLCVYSVASEPFCEPILIETCQGIGYELTTTPNLLGHETQAQANREVSI